MRFRACLIIGLVSAFPLEAAIRVQQIRQIPAEPRQAIARMTMDSRGNIVATGTYTYPEILSDPSTDGFVEKVDTEGHVLFMRRLPGAQHATLRLALDSHDDIYVTGQTLTPSAFPFTVQSPAPGGVFVVKLRAQDGTLAYATSLRGITAGAIMADSNGEVLLTIGEFRGVLATTPGAYSSTFGGGSLSTLMYLVRLSAAGDKIVFAASYGGSQTNCYGGSGCISRTPSTGGTQILLDRQNNIWVTGVTDTTDLPLTSGALKKTCGCSQFSGDGFLAEFSGDGSRLLYATYVGTSTGGVLAFDGDDFIASAVMDTAGHIWMAGTTSGPDLPVTTNALQKEFGGGKDGFIFEYDPTSNTAPYVSYFGGGDDDAVTNIAIGPDGGAVFAGHAASAPVAGSGFMRGSDFIATLSPAGMTTLVNTSAGAGLAFTPAGLAVVSGTSCVATVVETNGDASPSLFAVTSTAGIGATGQVAPGELVALYGANIGPATPASADLRSGPAPMQLGGVQVLLDGNPVPLLYAQSDQINAIIPFDLARKSTVTLVVNNAGADSNGAILGVVEAAPDAYKTGPRLWAAALNQDQTVNSPDNPAAPGTVVAVFGTGFGLLSPKPPDGSVLTGTMPSLARPVEVLFDGRSLEVQYAGPAPFLVAGVSQVNFRLPGTSGEPTFELRVAGWPSGNFVVVMK